MVNCSVFQCKNRSERNDVGITFHTFPKDVNIKTKWIMATGRSEWTPTKYSRICSTHFEKKNIRKRLQRTTLCHGAIPTLNIKAPTAMMDVMMIDKPGSQDVTQIDFQKVTVKNSQDVTEQILQDISNSATSSNRQKFVKTNDSRPSVSAKGKRRLISAACASAPSSMGVMMIDEPGSQNVTEIDFQNVTIKNSQDLTEQIPQDIYTNSATSPNRQKFVKMNDSRPSVSVKGKRRLISAACASAPSNDSPLSSMFSTPRKKKLQRKLVKSQLISKLRLQKLRAVRIRSLRLKRKNAELTDILTNLRAKLLINSEQEDLLLSTEDPVKKDFLKRFLVKDKCPRKYSEALRKFALCLHFISPAAYSYVRKVYNTCLPHPKTISRWYSTVNCEPGFTQESLDALKKICSGTKYYCAISMDEMSIRQKLEWNGKRIVGYVNIGDNLDSDSLPIAKDALVFMVTCLNGSFKIPVGYFLTNGVTAAQRGTLLKTCVELVEEVGIKVVSVTFDGCPSNISMAKLLGAKLDNLNTIDPTIMNSNIVIFPDPCHMIKLVRNALAEKKEFVTSENKVISWKHVQNLHTLQEAEGMNLANKLRKSHVNFHKQIMKVRLAVQTLSKSVSESLLFCKNNLNLEDFQDSEATAQFISCMNQIFDILNSRTFNTYGFKKPISSKNYPEINFFFEQFEVYLKSLKINNQQVLTSGRKMGFLGLLICMKSLDIIYYRYIHNEEVPLKFLCTYKMSQDHLEVFFSAIRSKGGFNNNPSAVQFQAAYKRLLIHGELKNISTGNCLPFDGVTILTCKFVRKINETKNRLLSIDESDTSEDTVTDYIDVPEDHDYYGNFNLSEVSEQITIYIAGFIVTKITKIIKCDQCLVSLLASERFTGLILHKDKGGLHYPSKDVIKICIHAEKVFRTQFSATGSEKIKNVMPKMVIAVLKKFIGTSIFTELDEHIREQSPADNHVILLIKAITYKYLEVRLHYYLKNLSLKNERIRNFHNKLVLFKGQ